MKLGLSSFSVGWSVGPSGDEAGQKIDFLDLIEMTAKYDLNLLQIGDNLPLDKVPAGQLQEAKARLEKYGIELEVGTRGLYEDNVDTYLKLAEYFHAKLIRIVIDQGDYEPSEAEIIALLKKLAPRLEEKKIYLAIENHDRLKAAVLAGIINKVSSPYVGICLDTANSLGAGEGIDQIINVLAPYTVNLHIKDFTISRLYHQMGFIVQGTAAGQGALNISDLIESVRNNGRDANCILELWTPPEKSAKDTCEKEMEYVRKSVEYLKPLIKDSLYNIKFGASTAYTISRFGAEFKIPDIISSLKELSAAGFSIYQPEISFFRQLADWENGGIDRVNECCAETGMKINQLIAHFIMEYFCDDKIVEMNDGIGGMERFIKIAKGISGCDQILVPIGTLVYTKEKTSEHMERVKTAFWGKLAKIVKMAEESELKVSFELLPGNFIGSYSELFSQGEKLGIDSFGVNLDTAHAFMNKESVSELPGRYKERIWGTHLGDTNGRIGEKLVPGRGILGWEKIVKGLTEFCNLKSLDLEIFSSPDTTLESYIEGRRILMKCMMQLHRGYCP
jgi:sugar phosphate isomerase/epimerase